MSDNKFSFLGFPMGFQRADAFPIDRSSVFYSYDDAVEYAKGLYQGESDTEAVAHDSRGLASTSYIGQIIAVLTVSGESVTACDIYKIDFDRTLKAVGGAGSASEEPLPEAPSTSDTDYDLGTVWVTQSGGIYVFTGVVDGNAKWTAVATADQIANLGGGDMLKSSYDDNDDGKVNAADKADKLATARNIGVTGAFTGLTQFDGSDDVSIELTPSAEFEQKMSDWDGAVQDSHTHENEEVLSGITAGKVAAWDAAQPNVVEVFKINGSEVSIVDKSIDISVPTAPGDIGAAAADHNHDEVYTKLTDIFDESGVVLASKLPSFVDDVIEVENFEALPSPVGETGKIYVTLNDNKTYRWSGTKYTVIGNDLALGNTAATAFRGDYGQIAYDHSQEAHAPANAQENIIEIFKVNGVPMEVAEKSVNLPVAGEVLGVVKTSDAKNGVSVAEDGTMSVNSVDVSKLVISEGDELILDGGTA